MTAATKFLPSPQKFPNRPFGSIAVKTWSLSITLHPSVNVHTVSFLSLQGKGIYQRWSCQTTQILSVLAQEPASTLVCSNMHCPVFSACPKSYLLWHFDRYLGVETPAHYPPDSPLVLPGPPLPPTPSPMLRKFELENLNSGVNALTMAGGSGMKTREWARNPDLPACQVVAMWPEGVGQLFRASASSSSKRVLSGFLCSLLSYWLSH